MSEVLSLVYEAFGPSIRVVVDTVVEMPSGALVPVLGGLAQPERHFTLAKLDELDAQLAADLRSVLARLEPLARAKAVADEADPARMREEANRIAQDRQWLEREKAEHERAIEEARAEARRLDLEIQAKREQLTHDPTRP